MEQPLAPLVRVESWTPKPAGPDVLPDGQAWAAKLPCGHAYEAHFGHAATVLLPSMVICGVCEQAAREAKVNAV